MTPKISVIIPMFNSERFVGTAIRTVLDQTFKDFELILIDDCSTDRTLEIAEDFVRSDRRIRIVRNEKNLGGESGPGVVRNVGLDRARGEFVYSMDNDDALLPDALQLLFDTAVETNADVLINTKNYRERDVKFRSIKDIPKLHTQVRGKMNARVAQDLKARVWNEYGQFESSAAPWNHFWRREFLDANGIRFKAIQIHDDGLFLMELLCATNKIVKLDKPFYVWRKQADSITHSTIKTEKGVNFDGFAKRVRSFLIIVDGFEEVLSKAMMREYGEIDRAFIDRICLSIKDRALVGSLRPAFEKDPDRCQAIVRAEVEKHYGSSLPMLNRMIFGYFEQAIAARSEHDQNTKLKSTLKTIRDSIQKVSL